MTEPHEPGPSDAPQTGEEPAAAALETAQGAAKADDERRNDQKNKGQKKKKKKKDKKKARALAVNEGEASGEKQAGADGAGAADAPTQAGAPHALAAQFDFTKTLPKAIAKAAFGSGGYEYAEKLDSDVYDETLLRLQIELQKAMAWIKDKGERVCIVFEGRDAAGKGGSILRLTQHLSPRCARVVALPKPTETERGQWYFQRYVAQMPTRGEMVVFDRSWYNRAGVEPVFGFCTPAETERFLNEAPEFEKMLARDGVRIVKFFLTIGREMQMKRLSERYQDPLARWKISPMDNGAVEKWDAYSQAYDRMLSLSDHAAAPWTIIRANDKKRARLAVIRHVLTVLPYAPHDAKPIGHEDPKIVLSASDYLGQGGER
jgi:polyphosphate kinase 2